MAKQLHKAYDENPICYCCHLAISQEYMQTHLHRDHTPAEVATALARITVEDYQEMFEYSPELEGKTEQKEA